jgi:two-component system response regulator HupR/HoxA
MDRLTAAVWPGNVRELENEIERVVALAPPDADRVTVEMLSEEVRGGDGRGRAAASGPRAIVDWDLNRSVDTLKRQMILEAIREEGSKTRAAEKLGIPRQSLQKMMKRLELSDEEVAADRPDEG